MTEEEKAALRKELSSTWTFDKSYPNRVFIHSTIGHDCDKEGRCFPGLKLMDDKSIFTVEPLEDWSAVTLIDGSGAIGHEFTKDEIRRVGEDLLKLADLLIPKE